MSDTDRLRAAKLMLIINAMTVPQPEADQDSCKMCGHAGKNPTGECHNCGVYCCATCSKYHMGDPAQACNGLGIEL